MDAKMSKKITITKKRHLEMMLQQIPPHKSPKVHLEQYTTPQTLPLIFYGMHTTLEISKIKKWLI